MLGIIFPSCLLLEMMYHYILFQIFHELSLFLFVADIYVILEISHNIPHLRQEKPSHKAIWQKFRFSYAKMLRNLIMIFICEKVRLQQVGKSKYSILASMVHIFQNIFLTQSYTYLYNTQWNLMIFSYLALNQDTFRHFFFEQDQVVSRAKWQKMTQNDKKKCLSRSISHEAYIISSFMVHMCKRRISPGSFYIF